MPAYAAAMVRRASGGSVDHNVGGVAGASGDRWGRVWNAEAMRLIGSFLSGSFQQRPQAFRQGQQRPHGDARMALIGRHALNRLGHGTKVGGRPADLATPSVGQNNRNPFRTAR